MLRFLFFSADHSYISAEILLIFLLPEDLNPAVPESGSSHTDHHVQPDPSWKRFPYLSGGFFFPVCAPSGILQITSPYNVDTFASPPNTAVVNGISVVV